MSAPNHWIYPKLSSQNKFKVVHSCFRVSTNFSMIGKPLIHGWLFLWEIPNQNGWFIGVPLFQETSLDVHSVFLFIIPVPNLPSGLVQWLLLQYSCASPSAKSRSWQSMEAQWIQNGMQHGLMMFNDSSSMAELFCQCLLVFFWSLF